MLRAAVATPGPDGMDLRCACLPSLMTGAKLLLVIGRSLHRSFHPALPLAILIQLLGMGATIYGYKVIKEGAAEADSLRFSNLVEDQMAGIASRLESYESVLYGGIGFLSGSTEVTKEDWEHYVASIPIKRAAPGILGIGTISQVPAGEREARLLQYRKQFGEGFTYKTVDGAAPSDVSYIIDRIAPSERNHEALGLDVATERQRREAFEKARDSGQPQVTGIITLVQDYQKSPAFLLMIPRYRLARPLETPEERRAAFLDVVYAPMSGKDVLELPSTSDNPEIGFAVYDELAAPERLIHHTGDPDGFRTASHRRVTVWPYAGRKWVVHTWTSPSFVSKSSGKPHFTFLGVGMTLTTLLAAVVFAIHRSHLRAIRVMGEVETAMKEKESINNLFVEHAPAAIAILDNNLCYLSVSRRWMEHYHLKGDIIGRHHYDVFPEIRDMPEWREIHQRCLDGSHEMGEADRFVRADGSTQYLNWEIHPWHRADESIGGIMMFSHDVTSEVEGRLRLKSAQKELELTEERLRQATAAGNVGIWDWKIDEDVLVWNEQMFQLFGVDRESFTGKGSDFLSAVHPGDVEKIQTALRSTFEQDVDYEIEYRTIRKDHPTVLAMGQVHRDEQGNPVRMLGVCVDVSQQMKVRDELVRAGEHHARARREAENMVKVREQFLATMSHEIRTPMNGMIGMSELLLTTPLDEQQKEFTQTIIQCGNSLLTLINDILDLSKIEAGKMQVESCPFDPAEMADRVVRILLPQCDKKSLKLELVVDEKVPRQLLGDENRIQQVLLNLVSNAIKFTSSGGIRIQLCLLHRVGSSAEIAFRIKDSGVGMTEEEIHRVFIPFVQADASTTRKYGGTGLGLSISRSLMLLMGGSLELESKPGEGTVATVRIKLPMVPDTRYNANRTDDGAAAAKLEDPLKFGRILIVEDNPVNQRVTELQMKPFADVIEIAADGLEAVGMCREKPYDLILMDCQMPVMDGYEAARAIRDDEAARGLPRKAIIALTANVYERDRRKVFESGMDGFLAKPLILDVLRQELSAIQAGRVDMDAP